MKIALVMFGLLRNPHGLIREFPPVKDSYFNGMDVDVFCVTNNIVGRHEWSKGNRVINDTDELSEQTLNQCFTALGAKEYLVINFQDEIKETLSIVEPLRQRFPITEQPIQNTVSKWYKFNKGFQLCKNRGYDRIMGCRMDGKHVIRFSQSQLQSANKLHVLGPLWAGSHIFGNNNYERSEENVIREIGQRGYPDDFFYGPEEAIAIFEKMPSFLRELNPSICRYHPETIYTTFLKTMGVMPELIRWSRKTTTTDFFLSNAVLTNLGHTFPPDLTGEWKIKVL